MLNDDSGSTASETTTETSSDNAEAPKRRRAAGRPAGPPAMTTFSAAEPPRKPDLAPSQSEGDDEAPAKKSGGKKTAKKTTKKTAKKATSKKAAAAPEAVPEADPEAVPEAETAGKAAIGSPFAVPLFQPPERTQVQAHKPERSAPAESESGDDAADSPTDDGSDADSDDAGGTRRRRRRGGRRRRRGADEDGPDSAENDGSDSASETDDRPAGEESTDQESGDSDDDGAEGGKSTRRRRRRRRRGEESSTSNDDPANTVTRVRERRSAEDEITSVSGSTRLEAKKQRRREGREAGRRRAPIVTEAEFLARRESVKREMVIRQRSDLAQIAVLEDDVLVEHYVARESQTSLIGNVYVGRVQNVLPSMEAAFIDIGKGRNGVLYAGEVDWKALGDGKPRKIEEVLKSGQSVLVQVTKDPIGHKGARLTSQISLAGRFLVYVPGGQTNGISRKLPDTERSRLKGLLKEVLPDEAGVIIRTAAEGATEDQLTRDVSALTARWDDIESKSAKGNSPQLLYAEPDLMIKVVRDLFNEDFAKLVVEGESAWDMVEGYVQHVAPDLSGRLERWPSDGDRDVFASYRIDEQIAKATDRKVWLPSGGSLIIDRTEAMTVVDVNTGKFTGSGGNLEETVTKNNLEAAEEIVRQLRLRDIGGIIVIDFIDMVLENNRDLVLRRLVECLGRDRTRHQVAEVTSLGLVQMTRKRIGTGLVEAFSETCDHCHGRGLIVHNEPVEPRKQSDEPRGRRRGRGKADSDKSGSDKSEKSGSDKSEKSGSDQGDTKPSDSDQQGSDQADSAKQSSGKDGGEAGAKGGASRSRRGRGKKATAARSEPKPADGTHESEAASQNGTEPAPVSESKAAESASDAGAGDSTQAAESDTPSDQDTAGREPRATDSADSNGASAAEAVGADAAGGR